MLTPKLGPQFPTRRRQFPTDPSYTTSHLTLVEHACYLHTRQPPHCHQTRAAPLLPPSNEALQFIRFSLALKGRWHLTYILRSYPGRVICFSQVTAASSPPIPTPSKPESSSF
ncbi:hypothetical protein V496_05703 [Pseudogymnoascus sp. VKM F-4515 (FW-2607)]|nr:hypothetical protein V496_05703 [Pseudogymnoascus sp. VKM F-4515 (FW-2607)]